MCSSSRADAVRQAVCIEKKRVKCQSQPNKVLGPQQLEIFFFSYFSLREENFKSRLANSLRTQVHNREEHLKDFPSSMKPSGVAEMHKTLSLSK